MIEPPQIMIVGTYHMANPRLDYVDLPVDDVFTDQRQAELKVLCEQLGAFAPTHLALEYEPDTLDELNAEYGQYVAQAFTLKADEVYQIGFRVAAACGHKQLYGVDYHPSAQTLDIGTVVQYAAEHGQQDLVACFQQDGVTMQQASAQMGAYSVGDIIRQLNTPESDAFLHRSYLALAAMGDTDHPLGAQWVSGWYERNLRIYAGIAALACTPDTRVMVLIGAGHGALLRQFVAAAPHLTLVPLDRYVG